MKKDISKSSDVKTKNYMKTNEVKDEIQLSETSLEITNKENIDLTEESTEEIIEENDLKKEYRY